jgi:mRNA-degrading endonuclease HigB of HigAB toxin-antitoxin module
VLADCRRIEAGCSVAPKVCVVLNKANDYRLVAVAQYEAVVLMIRFFGSHEDYDKINAETI